MEATPLLSSSSRPAFTTTPTPFRLPPPLHLRHHSTAVPAAAAATTAEPRRDKPPRFRDQDLFPNSLPIHTKNPRAIYRDLKRLARQGNLAAALTILDYLDRRGVPVNATAFAALLTACALSKSLPFTRQIHAHLRTNRLDSSSFLLTKLVLAYAAAGSPADARRALSRLDSPPTTVYPWNALLRGNVLGGGRWGYETLDVFDEMRGRGVDCNEYSFSCLIKSLAGSPSGIQGAKAHAILIKNGYLDSSLILRTSLIDMYFKCRKIRQAMKLFEEMPEKDIVGWGAVIAGFAHNGLKREVLEYLRMMRDDGIEPNSVILATVIPVIGELSERRIGQELHGFVLKYFKNYQKQDFVLSALVDMYCKCGDIASARRVFYGTTKRNTVLWTALISGYSSSGRLDQSLRSIIWMQQEGIKPDIVSIATVIPVCNKLKALKQGKEIHAYALKRWFLPNISLSTSLMTMYSSCGYLAYSRNMFNEMERKNVVAWTALFDSYMKNGRPRDALSVFRSMQLSKHRPDSVAMARALCASGEVAALLLGKEIHGHVLRRKLEWQPFVSAEIISMYGRCGQVEMADRVFDRVPSKGSLTWTSILDAYGFNGLYREALDLFDQLQSNGFIPNEITFDVVLAICASGGLADEALKVYDSMVRQYKLEASEEQRKCLIGLLTDVGRREEAQMILQSRTSAVG